MLIAEIGNNHMGSMKAAKELIRVAMESGADLVKGQAIRAGTIKSGSMPLEFYKTCEMSFNQYVELIDYGASIGIDVFFSIFDKRLLALAQHQKWNKLSGYQTKNMDAKTLERFDSRKCIMSFKRDSYLPPLKKAHVLYVTEYLDTDPQIEYISAFQRKLGRPVGYSDHTIGIECCVRAVKEFGAHIVEKHFTLHRDIFWGGQQFRDVIHAADPKQFEELATKTKTGGIECDMMGQ